MIPVLGYWVLGNTRQYRVVLVLGDTFIGCDASTNTSQTAVSSTHRITILTPAVWPVLADNYGSLSGEGVIV